MKRKQISWDELRDALSDVISIATTLSELEEDGIVKNVLQGIIANAQADSKRCDKCEQLQNFRGYQFAVIDPETHEVRKASYDEGMRLIMDYPPREAGGAVQILQRMKNYTKAHDGQEPDTSNWDWLNDPSAKTDIEKETR